ncbi:MAG: HD-GYP domain-containing protein, partial [archaeon]
NIYILNQSEAITQKIKSYSDILFDPKIVDVFLYLAKIESFWLNISTDRFKDILNDWGKNIYLKLSLNNLEEITSVFAKIIDRKSAFTARHSSGVATLAALISSEMNFSVEKQQAIRIAGLIHDIGKLIIPKNILEKNGKLNDNEFNIIKQHPFYTYKLLNNIKGLSTISRWAAYHHEKMDGTGYPFKLNKNKLDLGCRIMAVSDIFQALTEERPYRPAYKITKAMEILKKYGTYGKLDTEIISVLEKNI